MIDLLITVALIILLLVLILTTYRIRNPLWRWLAITIPPLILLPLAVLPARGPATVFFALPIMIVLPISIISFVFRGIQVIKSRQMPLLKYRLVRPSIAIVVCIIVLSNHRYSLHLAHTYAFDLARSTQRESIKNNRCPESISGWTNTSSPVFSDDVFISCDIKKMGIQYPLHYQASPDGQSFTLILVRGFNMQTTIMGGVSNELMVVYSDEDNTRKELL